MDKILEILKEIRPECEFDKSQNFIEDYLLDSFDIVQLVSELEEEYEITIEPSQILPENFISLERIKNLIEKLK
ncbi:MAG: acyl carrier protein [Acetivibrio sp.]